MKINLNKPKIYTILKRFLPQIGESREDWEYRCQDIAHIGMAKRYCVWCFEKYMIGEWRFRGSFCEKHAKIYECDDRDLWKKALDKIYHDNQPKGRGVYD